VKTRWIDTPIERAADVGECALAPLLDADCCDGAIQIGENVHVGDGARAHVRCVEEAFLRANSFDFSGRFGVAAATRRGR
jgi:hypothetical protein